MIYKTQNNQSIFDVIINTTVDLDATYALISANPTIKNIESVPIGIDVEFTAPTFTPPSVKSADPGTEIISQNFYSKNNQTIYDIALQTYGNLDFTYKLIKDSNFTNIQTTPIPTTLFIFNPQLIIDNSFRNYLSANGIVINTGQKSYTVFAEEDLQTIFISEDGTTEFTPES